MIKYIILVFLCHILYAKECCAEQCKKTGNCKCEYEDGHGIDMGHIIESGQPALRTVDNNNNTYMFSPCVEINYTPNTNLTEDTCKEGFTLCQCDNNKTCNKLGALKNAQFITSDSDSLYLVYSEKQSVTSIELICTVDKESHLFSHNRTTNSFNETKSFLLFSPYACKIMVEDFSKPSTGTVLLILFFIGVVTYFSIGVTVNFLYLGARGVEVIPNLDFWKDLPQLVREGALFLQNGCKAERTPDPDSYDAI